MERVRPGDPVVLYSSLPGVLNGYVSPVLLILLSAWAGWTRGPTLLSTGIGAVGVAFVAIALFDMPLHTVFGREGVVRVCALRRHHLAWTSITAIERVPKRMPLRRVEGRPRRPGGLVAVIGKRKYLLCNRPEGAFEFDALQASVRQWDDAVAIRAGRPPETTVPTNLHRRRR